MRPLTHVFPSLVVLFLGGYAYANTLAAPFVFDDFVVVVNNPAIRDLGDLPAVLGWVPPRALGVFTFALNYAVHGLDVRGFHLVNLLVHALAGIAVYGLVFQVLGLASRRGPKKERTWAPTHAVAAGLAAAVFVSHPLQTQAVTYIWQRVTSLAAMFYVVALLCFARAAHAWLDEEADTRWHLAGWAAALAGMFTKQITFTLPLAVGLLTWAFLPRGYLRDRRGPLLGWAALLLVIPVVEVVLGDPAIDHIEGGVDRRLHPLRYLVTQIDVVALYLRLFAAPVGQSFDHPLPPSSLGDLSTWGSLAVHLALAGVAFALRKRAPVVSVGIALFYLALAVESTVLPLIDVAWEHRVYLPSVGLVLALAGALAKVPAGVALVERLAEGRRLVYAWLAIAIAGLPLATLTHARNEVWLDRERLWADVLEQYPDGARAHLSLGLILANRDRPEEALVHLERAVELWPWHAKARKNYAIVLDLVGREDEALAQFAAAHERSPADDAIVGGWATSLARQGRYQEALKLVEKAQEDGPSPGLEPLEEKLREDLAHEAPEEAPDAGPRPR